TTKPSIAISSAKCAPSRAAPRRWWPLENKTRMGYDESAFFEREHGGCLISTDPAKLDLDAIHRFLSQAYWCREVPRSILERAIRNSLCFGLYVSGELAGFTRVITDRATFAYVADVFVLDSHRGRGFSKLLMSAVKSHPDLQGLRRWSLA